MSKELSAMAEEKHSNASCNQAVFCYNHLNMIHPIPIDITNIPELVRIAEEVEGTKTPRELRRKNKPVAIITPLRPVGRAKKYKAKTTADYEAFRTAAGSWKDVDTDKLLKDIYETRHRATRPPVNL